MSFRTTLCACIFAPVLLGSLASCALSKEFFGAAAPIAADALATYQARARELAPTLPADDPRVDDIARRLATLESTKARAQAADDCETAQAKSSDTSALVLALEEATRAKADAARARAALAAALRAIPVAVDAGSEGGAL